MRLRQNTAIAAIPKVLQRRFGVPGRISSRIKVRVVHVMDSMVVARFPVQKFYVGILLPRHDVNETSIIIKSLTYWL